MAKLKPLRLKEKEYVFKAYGNDKEKTPAKIVFDRFPASTELFGQENKKSLLEGTKNVDFKSATGQQELVKIFLDNYLNNIVKGQVDYAEFFKECVSRIDNFEYGDKKIITPDDFAELPADAVKKIGAEVYAYATADDEFTMGE
jgi:hypothetical protein